MGSWRNVLLSVFVACFFTVAREVQGGTEPWKKSEKSAERGAEVQLPCILISSQCGGLHSIKWYHGNTRIFIFSENVGLTRESNDIATRATMDYDVNTTKTYLRIPNVKLEDEGLYKCEATYLSVNRECNNVQHITLTVNVRPDYVRVIEKDEKINLTSGDVLGPINEGKLVSLRCESGEGKPVPTVEWYKGEEVLKANSSTNTQDGNIGTGSSELQITVGRNELDATFTCKVSSPALDEPLTLDVKLDVHVSPEKMDVKGVVGHVVSGTKILLECIVSAARPPANVTWYNGTELLNDENERLEMFGTNIRNNTHGTSDTDSHLAFTASEYDNGRMFSCVAENSVTVAEGIKPMKEVTIIEVLYPPIVTLRQENITVNETDEFDLFCDYVANPSELKSVKWLLDGEIINVGKNDHYDGGEASFAPLTVRNASSSDMGRYTCILENSVGESTVQDFIDVSVLYKPQVKVTMEPEVPVNEADRLNVSLTCEVVDGNPMTLTTVRWFLDGDLLKELPDCSRNSSLASDGASSTSTNGILVDEISTFCDIDPSKLLLEAVGRSFNGNYACEGRNDAGWGNRSASAPVVVYYKPGPATITYEPKRVVKKGSLNITCSVLDLGRPEVTGFKWFRGSHQISGEESAVLRIESVNLETKANFTCMAFNEAGDGDPATVFIDVAARPDFIKPLNGYAGFAYNSTNVSIECWVECSPICNISWERDGLPMNFDKTELYYQTNVYHPPDQSKNDFESIQSTLVWNMTAWPDGHLHPFRDNENFTCESTGNGIGPGVKSETVFRVEFPPENMTISKKIIDVIVDSIPESVKCSAVAEPEPMFRWFREGSTDVISTDAVHVFKTKVPRRSNGTYICQAYNRHGQNNITTYLNVLFKPECRIDEERIDGEYYLVCSATANPKESDFTWSLKSDNDTLDQIGEIRDGKGYLRLDTSITNFRTYVCVANNSIGFSLPCERGVPGNLPWWLQLEGDLLIIIIIVAMVILLAIVICCIVIWLICRRKRAQAKYPSQATNNNHVDSVSESLPEPETKTFYENLPFHGIQTPPNKLVTSPKFARVSALHGNSNSISIINSTNIVKPSTSSSSTVNAIQSTGTTVSIGTLECTTRRMEKRTSESTTNSGTVSPCSSQPASLSRRTSLCGASSGYESATNRSSHLGPHYSPNNMPRTNSPEPKYNTLKPLRRRKHKQTHSRFYSLRLCRKHSEAAAAAAASAAAALSSKSPTSLSKSRRNYQLYAIPIVKSCPHKSAINAANNLLTGSNSTIATTLRSTTPDLTPTSSLGRSKPSSPLPTPPPTPPNVSPPDSPATRKDVSNDNTTSNYFGTKIPPIPAPRSKKTDPSRHTYQNVPPPVFPSRNKKTDITALSSTSSSSSTITKHKLDPGIYVATALVHVNRESIEQPVQLSRILSAASKASATALSNSTATTGDATVRELQYSRNRFAERKFKPTDVTLNAESLSFVDSEPAGDIIHASSRTKSQHSWKTTSSSVRRDDESTSSSESERGRSWIRREW
ncbi:uncharacterized protein nrm isoform X3 [Venturia canescens]|uniref:uncharacterized protein nrm isoform X3 n=1 Tax=Venturia canescens TaxID=32260 RepID=UPI001C9C4682|nr:uncharacterized protein LOC122412953 isoform X3 [Venturia canescens]